jgi:hypothetical protein
VLVVQEKALGRIVKEKYKTDFYIMDQYPLCVSTHMHTHIYIYIYIYIYILPLHLSYTGTQHP